MEPFIKESFLGLNSQSFPHIIEPVDGRSDINEWMSDRRPQFESDLTKYGAILLRGFKIESVADFSRFMKNFNTEPLPYMFRSSPRGELDKSIKNIYTSTVYPNDRSINMHSESSYSRVWGKKIAFCCITPAEAGGETPLADTRKVLEAINPQLVEKFRKKGVKYRRNLFPDLGMPWQEVFQTDDEKVMSEICKSNDVAFKFGKKDHLTIEWTKKAVYRHPVSGEEVWFNHMFFFNKYSRYEELGLSYDDELPDEYLTSDTFFGDGTEIRYEEYLDVKEAYKKNMVIFPYVKGDIIFLDNMLAAHGRNPYKGERVIATAIIEAAYDADFV